MAAQISCCLGQSGNRGQRNWSGMYCIVIEDKKSGEQLPAYRSVIGEKYPILHSHPHVCHELRQTPSIRRNCTSRLLPS